MAQYTSPRKASIRATILSLAPEAARASVSSAESPTHGLSLASASPCTLLRPIRRPVNEPGPVVTAKASISGAARPSPRRSASTAGSSQRECPAPVRTRASASTPSSETTARLPRSVVVSTASTRTS